MGKNSKKDHFKCQKCKNVIQEEFVEVLGKFTCLECLEQCSCGCQKAIQGKFFTLSNGDKYAQDCFKCTKCEEIIDSEEFLECEEKPYHQDCIEKCCCGCEKTIGGEFTELPNGKKYIQGCLKCEHCTKSIKSQEYFIQQEKVLCKICKLKDRKQCFTCHQPIEQSHVTTLGKHYHYDCFKCSDCNEVSVTSQHGKKKEQPLCLECNLKSQSISKSQVLDLQKRLSHRPSEDEPETTVLQKK